MMEKPLAVNNADAQRIHKAAAARRHPGDRELRDDLVSEPRRDLEAASRSKKAGRRDPQDGGDGRPQGPKEINVQPEFFDWLSDPVRNGAGALFDFGCYGANLMTWMMDNQRPLAVTAITQQLPARRLPAGG